MYFASCGTETLAPTMFSAMTVVSSTAVYPWLGAPEKPIPTSVALVRATLDSSTGKWIESETTLLPECTEAFGLATSSDCKMISFLCRRPPGQKDFTKDMVASYGPGWLEWLTQKADEVWIYEWNNSSIKTKPEKYVAVAHRKSPW
jgi:hypothetical protein